MLLFCAGIGGAAKEFCFPHGGKTALHPSLPPPSHSSHESLFPCTSVCVFGGREEIKQLAMKICTHAIPVATLKSSFDFLEW